MKKKEYMKYLHMLAVALVLVGGLNWGLIALFNLNGGESGLPVGRRFRCLVDFSAPHLLQNLQVSCADLESDPILFSYGKGELGCFIFN